VNVARGEIWLADLNPVRGSEQAGVRPVLIIQNDAINPYTTTVVAVPLTTNLRRARLPSCTRVPRGEGGLASDSVALCHQVRVIDRERLNQRLGVVGQTTLTDVESRLLFTLGIA
jgi:mRNA interferase MazF